jgi:hypothetical protein
MTSARRRAVPLAIDPNDPVIRGILAVLAEHSEALAKHAEKDPAQPPPPGWLTADEAAELAHISVAAMRLRRGTGAVVSRLCRGEHGVQWFIDPASVRPRRLARGLSPQVGKRV